MPALPRPESSALSPADPRQYVISHREDYIRTARAKGLSERVVMVRLFSERFHPCRYDSVTMFAALITGTSLWRGFAGPGWASTCTSITTDTPVVRVQRSAPLLVIPTWKGYTYAFPDPDSLLIVGGVA
jgi:hypothetical protein